jgi:hypothetical protein
MAFAPKLPKYQIPTREIGVVCYPDRKAVGIQFADPEGNHIFITIPGALVATLAGDLNKVVADHPDAPTWPPAPYQAR